LICRLLKGARTLVLVPSKPASAAVMLADASEFLSKLPIANFAVLKTVLRFKGLIASRSVLDWQAIQFEMSDTDPHSESYSSPSKHRDVEEGLQQLSSRGFERITLLRI